MPGLCFTAVETIQSNHYGTVVRPTPIAAPTDARLLIAAGRGMDPGSINQITINDPDRLEACGACSFTDALHGFGRTDVTPEFCEQLLRDEYGEGGIDRGVAVAAIEFLADYFKLNHHRLIPPQFAAELVKGDCYLHVLTECNYYSGRLVPESGGEYGHYILSYDYGSDDTYGSDNPWGGEDRRYAGGTYLPASLVAVALSMPAPPPPPPPPFIGKPSMLDLVVVSTPSGQYLVDSTGAYGISDAGNYQNVPAVSMSEDQLNAFRAEREKGWRDYLGALAGKSGYAPVANPS